MVVRLVCLKQYLLIDEELGISSHSLKRGKLEVWAMSFFTLLPMLLYLSPRNSMYTGLVIGFVLFFNHKAGHTIFPTHIVSSAYILLKICFFPKTWCVWAKIRTLPLSFLILMYFLSFFLTFSHFLPHFGLPGGLSILAMPLHLELMVHPLVVAFTSTRVLATGTHL